MASHVNTSILVHDRHANTIRRAQTSLLQSISAFVNQDIQVRSVSKSQLYFITVETSIMII
jgi:hypothetical protein